MSLILDIINYRTGFWRSKIEIFIFAVNEFQKRLAVFASEFVSLTFPQHEIQTEVLMHNLNKDV